MIRTTTKYGKKTRSGSNGVKAMRLGRFTGILMACGAVALASTAAQADMGTAPVTQGIIVGSEGGFLFQSLEDINGHGVRPLGGPIGEAMVSPETGWFTGSMIGYASQQPMLFQFTRIEGYLLFGRTEDSTSSSVPPSADLTLKTVDGGVNVVGGRYGKTTVERRTYEGGLRFERDVAVDPQTNVTWVFQPFLRFMDEDTDTAVTNCCTAYRNADVDNRMVGVIVAIEPEYWFNSGMAIVGRAGVGFYGYDSDGHFRSYSQSPTNPDPFAASVTDDASGVGFRGSLGASLKFVITPSTRFETFAEADYFSTVAYGVFSNASPTDGTPSRIETDDMWELRTGARLTLSLD